MPEDEEVTLLFDRQRTGSTAGKKAQKVKQPVKKKQPYEEVVLDYVPALPLN